MVIKEEVEANTLNQDIEVNKITGEAIKTAVTMMKKGKCDVSGSYTTDAIKNAPDILYEHLASVYRSWLVHGTVSRPLLACAFLPLLKSSLKDPADTKSYRAIAGSSTLLMVFDRLVLNLWGDRLASGSLQMGYKRGSSTAQCSYMVMETISHFMREGTNPILVALDMTMAFDKCKFSILFRKIAKKIPPVVTRALIFVYERQYAWARWGSTKSEEFGITNGTRQGSVLSPALFTVYVQELLDRLQALGQGCHVGHTFLGAVAWADDFLLTAPSRGSMQSMLDVASAFTLEVGLEFSTDPNPAKSKSKSIYMIGRRTGLQKPAALVLSGQDLPWVQHATHLGHEFHEDGTMEMDTRMRRASFIGRSLEVQEAFSFATPDDTLGAVKLYCGDLYGGMLARLDSQAAIQLMNCWGVTVKDVWDVPRATHRVYARWLSGQHRSFREDLLSRWVKFYQSLLTGPSLEVAVIARVAAGDLRSTTGANNRLILNATGLDAKTATSQQVRQELQEREGKMSEEQQAVALELTHLLEERSRLQEQDLDTLLITQQISNLCQD